MGIVIVAVVFLVSELLVRLTKENESQEHRAKKKKKTVESLSCLTLRFEACSIVKVHCLMEGSQL